MRSSKSGLFGEIKFKYTITVTYLLLGFLWIVFSDKALDSLVQDDTLLTKFQTWKGSFYVIITALVLYLMVRGHIQKLDKAELQRLEGENRYKSLFQENLSVMLIINPADGKIEDANRAACNYYGWTRSELCNKHIGDIDTMPLEEIPKVLINSKLKKQNHLFFKHRLASGAQRDVEVFTGPITFGKSILLYAIVHDITEQCQLEESLKVSEEKFRTLFENHSAVKIIVDPETGNIVDANPAAAGFYGWSIAELKKMKIGMINTAPKEMLKEAMDQITSQGNANFEFKHRCKDGTTRDVEVLSSSIVINGHKYIHAIVHDVSAKRKIFDELVQAKERAEASDRLKTAFMNNISHEIRTPLNAIQGFAPMISDPLLDAKEKEQLVEILDKSSRRLIQTITNYMDISLITSGNMEVVKADFGLDGMLAEIVRQFKDQCQGKGLQLVINVADSVSSSILHEDQGILLKILGQLLDNAIKFSTKGTISLDIRIKNDAYEFQIQDTGVGIKQEALATIFHHFVQEDNSNTRAYEGSGLGLSIVYGLVSLLGGSIKVESVKGSGSSFSFNIPWKSQTVSPIAPKTNLPKEMKSTRPLILIAEDEDSNYRLMEIILKSSYDIVRAENGMEAVAISRSTPGLDLILMDIKMPVMNGYEATRQIRLFNNDICIIAQTAYGLLGDREKALEAGCNDYIVKPIGKESLLAIVENSCQML